MPSESSQDSMSSALTRHVELLNSTRYDEQLGTPNLHPQLKEAVASLFHQFLPRFAGGVSLDIDACSWREDFAPKQVINLYLTIGGAGEGLHSVCFCFYILEDELAWNSLVGIDIAADIT